MRREQRVLSPDPPSFPSPAVLCRQQDALKVSHIHQGSRPLPAKVARNADAHPDRRSG